MSEKIPHDFETLNISEDDLRTTPKPIIVNVVATYDLSNPTIDTEQLTLRLPGLGFNPQRFAAAKMRLPRPMTLAFCGGRAVCPGSRSVMAARIAALRFAEMHLRAGEYVQYRKFHVQNIVMSVWADFEVELASIRAEYSARTEYKSSKFPGLSFRVGSGKRRIVFNIFVTGRVVITGSKKEEHSYRAWWWMYTNVLQRHRRTSAPGTTSSAVYRMNTHRRLDTLAQDCEQISSRHTRREDGPMASSTYGDYLSTPSTPQYIPVTPRSAVSGGGNRALQGVALFFDRMNRFFGGHTATCPFVVAPESSAPRQWFEAIRDIDAAYSDAESAAQIVQKHVDCGCVASTVFMRQENVMTLLRRYQSQLRAAIGTPILRLIDDAEAPFYGHTPACPFVADATSSSSSSNPRDVWREQREILEIAMVGGVDSLEYDEHALAHVHSDAGCTQHDIKMMIVQLHHACDDFSDNAKSHENGDDGDDDELMVEFDSFTIDDARDYEILYRLEMIRQRPDDWQPRVKFTL